jgi:hypothetical protein
VKTWKEVARPGVYWYKDRAGQPRKLVVTKAAIQHLYQQGRDMLAANLAIPAPIEHQKEATPKTAAELAASTLRNNAGWIRDYRVNQGALEANVEITDKKIQQQITDGSVVHTSPKIDPEFMAGNGKTYKNAITHLALTLRPRIADQKPFQNAAKLPPGFETAAVLSLDHLESTTLPESVTPKSHASFGVVVNGSEKAWVLRDPVMFAMEEDAMAKDDEMADDDATAESDSDTGVPPVEPAQTSDLGDIMSMLEQKGIHLPPDTTLDNLVAHLKVALHAVCGPEDKAAEEAEAMAAENQAPEAPTVQEQQPLYMSLNYVTETLAKPKAYKTSDPVMLSLLADANRERAARAGMLKRQLDGAKARRATRIAGLCARGPKAKELEKDLLKQHETAELAISADGQIRDGMDATLSALERVIADERRGLLNPVSGGANLGEEVAHPSEMGNGMPEDRRQALVAAMAKKMGNRNGQTAAAK